MTKYDQAILVLEKIAEWDPEFHHMTDAESFVCCQNMAKTFLKHKNNSKEGNIITTTHWE